ncbi:adventurous gliding motility protein AgmC [Pyxidicoccus sp. 3LFB2]
MNRSSLSRAVMAVAVLTAFVAVAGPDSFFVGNGRSGAPTFTTAAPVEKVINNYAQVTAPLAPGDKQITIGTATGPANEATATFTAGALVMVLQTTGLVPATAEGDEAPIDLTENPVGRWELARLAGQAGSTLTLVQPLKHSYAANVTQVIVVPEYTNLTINTGVTVKALPWDGSKGGVVAFLVFGGLTNNGTISAKAAGFRGGVYARSSKNGSNEYMNCDAISRPTGAPSEVWAAKGEGLNSALYNPNPAQSALGVGTLATGGGGGVCNHGGGGGGGNAGVGGRGGSSTSDDGEPCHSRRQGRRRAETLSAGIAEPGRRRRQRAGVRAALSDRARGGAGRWHRLHSRHDAGRHWNHRCLRRRCPGLHRHQRGRRWRWRHRPCAVREHGGVWERHAGAREGR